MQKLPDSFYLTHQRFYLNMVMRRSFQRFGFLLILAAWMAVCKGYSQQVMSPEDLQLLHLASTAYEEERYIEVIELMEGYLKMPVENPDPWLLLASSHMAIHDPGSAEYTIDRALALMPDHPRLLQGKADLHLEQEEYQEALHIFKTLYRRVPADGTDSEEQGRLAVRIASLNTHLGGVAFEKNQLDEAEAYFEEALVHQPDSLHNYTNLAFVKTENDDLEGALSVLNSGLNQFPGHSRLQKWKASTLSSLEDSDGLEEVLAELVYLEPNNLELAGNYLTLLLYNEQFDKAEQFVEKLLKDKTLSSAKYRILADAYEKNGYSLGQIRVLEQYLREYPDDNEVMLEMAALLTSVNKTGQAKEIYWRLFNNDISRAGMELARIYTSQDSLDTAETLYETMVSEHQEDLGLLWEYAAFLNQMNRPDDAIAPLDQILEANRDASYLYERALAGDRSGASKEALDMYEDLAEQGFYHPAMFLRLVEEERSVPGLGEGCEAVQSLFNLILKQTIREQNSLLAQLSDGNGNLFMEEAFPGPAEIDLSELNKISGAVLDEITLQCGTDTTEVFIEDLMRVHGNSGRMSIMAARFFDKKDRPERALGLAEKAVSLSPNLPEVHYYHGQLLEQQHKLGEAAIAYERVLSLDDRHNDAYAALIRIYRNTNRLDELCDRWLLRYGTNRDNEVFYRHLYNALLRAGRWEDLQGLQG